VRGPLGVLQLGGGMEQHQTDRQTDIKFVWRGKW